MDPKQFLDMARTMTAEHGFPLPIDVLPIGAFDLDGTSMGVTAFQPSTGLPVRFGFTADFIAYMTEFEARQVVLHEIAHAQVGHKHGHDDVWAAQARANGVHNPQAHGEFKRVGEAIKAYMKVSELDKALAVLAGQSALGVWTYEDPTPWPDMSDPS